MTSDLRMLSGGLVNVKQSRSRTVQGGLITETQSDLAALGLRPTAIPPDLPRQHLGPLTVLEEFSVRIRWRFYPAHGACVMFPRRCEASNSD